MEQGLEGHTNVVGLSIESTPPTSGVCMCMYVCMYMYQIVNKIK